MIHKVAGDATEEAKHLNEFAQMLINGTELLEDRDNIRARTDLQTRQGKGAVSRRNVRAGAKITVPKPFLLSKLRRSSLEADLTPEAFKARVHCLNFAVSAHNRTSAWAEPYEPYNKNATNIEISPQNALKNFAVFRFRSSSKHLPSNL